MQNWVFSHNSPEDRKVRRSPKDDKRKGEHAPLFYVLISCRNPEWNRVE